ncbi:MAG TPA: hypothetical protein VIN09_02510 [Chloroflexota bacterium]
MRRSSRGGKSPRRANGAATILLFVLLGVALGIALIRGLSGAPGL